MYDPIRNLQKICSTVYGSCFLFVFLSNPDCPKQPRTSFSFYKFFYPTIFGRISDGNPKLNLTFLQLQNIPEKTF